MAEGGHYILGQVASVKADGSPLVALALESGQRCRPIASCSRVGRGSARCCPMSLVRASVRRGRSRSTSARRPATRAGCRRRCRCGSTTARTCLRHPRQRQPRLQGGRRHATARPSIPPTAIGRTRREMLAEARAFLRLRFPAIADAPLLGSEVCQYEADVRLALPHRPSPGGDQRVAGRRRLRPWLQDGACARRVRRQARAR